MAGGIKTEFGGANGPEAQTAAAGLTTVEQLKKLAEMRGVADPDVWVAAATAADTEYTAATTGLDTKIYTKTASGGPVAGAPINSVQMGNAVAGLNLQPNPNTAGYILSELDLNNIENADQGIQDDMRRALLVNIIANTDTANRDAVVAQINSNSLIFYLMIPGITDPANASTTPMGELRDRLQTVFNNRLTMALDPASGMSDEARVEFFNQIEPNTGNPDIADLLAKAGVDPARITTEKSALQSKLGRAGKAFTPRPAMQAPASARTAPAAAPAAAPTVAPAAAPTVAPAAAPTVAPTVAPAVIPTATPAAGAVPAAVSSAEAASVIQPTPSDILSEAQLHAMPEYQNANADRRDMMDRVRMLIAEKYSINNKDRKVKSAERLMQIEEDLRRSDVTSESWKKLRYSAKKWAPAIMFGILAGTGLGLAQGGVGGIILGAGAAVGVTGGYRGITMIADRITGKDKQWYEILKAQETKQNALDDFIEAKPVYTELVKLMMRSRETAASATLEGNVRVTGSADELTDEQKGKIMNYMIRKYGLEIYQRTAAQLIDLQKDIQGFNLPFLGLSAGTARA